MHNPVVLPLKSVLSSPVDLAAPAIQVYLLVQSLNELSRVAEIPHLEYCGQSFVAVSVTKQPVLDLEHQQVTRRFAWLYLMLAGFEHSWYISVAVLAVKWPKVDLQHLQMRRLLSGLH